MLNMFGLKYSALREATMLGKQTAMVWKEEGTIFLCVKN